MELSHSGQSVRAETMIADFLSIRKGGEILPQIDCRVPFVWVVINGAPYVQ